MKDKKEKKKSPIGWIVFVVAILFSLIDENTINSSGFAIFAVVAVIILIVVAVNVAKKLQGKDFMGKVSEIIGEDDADEELYDCKEADHIDIDPSDYTTEDEKRIKQLKSMLKNGIISREEYKLMLKRYGL